VGVFPPPSRLPCDRRESVSIGSSRLNGKATTRFSGNASREALALFTGRPSIGDEVLSAGFSQGYNAGVASKKFS
jgi:hypothetical protein